MKSSLPSRSRCGAATDESPRKPPAPPIRTTFAIRFSKRPSAVTLRAITRRKTSRARLTAPPRQLAPPASRWAVARKTKPSGGYPMADAPVAPPPTLYDPAISLGARLSQIAAETPDAPALTDVARTLTWREFDRRTNQIARGLASAGVKAGDVVSIALPNVAGYLEVAFGLWKLGATPQMLSYRLP